jgi:hypothetical protein
MIAAGAILRYAVTAHVSWIDIQTAGTVLLIVGVMALLIALWWVFSWSDIDDRGVHDY